MDGGRSFCPEQHPTWLWVTWAPCDPVAPTTLRLPVWVPLSNTVPHRTQPVPWLPSPWSTTAFGWTFLMHIKDHACLRLWRQDTNQLPGLPERLECTTSPQAPLRALEDLLGPQEGTAQVWTERSLGTLLSLLSHHNPGSALRQRQREALRPLPSSSEPPHPDQ